MIRRLLDRFRARRIYANLSIGEGTAWSRDNLDGIAPQLVTIGRDCVIAPRALLLTHDASLLVHEGVYIVRPVTIGDRVFVGYGALVMPGVTIGDGSIVGAGSIVTKDVPAGLVVAGSPAEPIGAAEDLIAAQDPSTIVAPPYTVTLRPTPAQVLALQRRFIDAAATKRTG